MQTIKKCRLVVVVAGSLLVSVGCKKEEPKTDSPPPAPAPTGLNIGGSGPITDPAAPVAPPPVAAEDFSAPRRVEKATGRDTTDLELLNQVAARYFDPAAQPGAGDVAPVAPIKPITSVDDLVRAGWIRKAPTPPAGKEFKFDPNTKQFTLADKK